MPDDTIDPHAAKLLGDLLALVLSENQSQAEAAIGAIRRRAARDAVSAGALKHLAGQLLGRPPEGDGPAARELTELRWTVADKARELDRSRAARRRAEAALADVQKANNSLAANVGQLRQERRAGWQLGFLLGLALGGGCFALYGAENGFGRGPQQTFDRVSRAEVSDYLHNCFISSSNSLAGSPWPLHLLIDVDADGRITGAKISPEQAELGNPDQKMYGSMLLRTLDSGSCGSLPLPASLRGKAGRLDLHLPR